MLGAAIVGTLIGGGLAYAINSVIDAAFGTNQAELMLQSDTYTGADIKRDAKFDRDVKISEAKQKKEMSTPEYISQMSKDPRNLEKLVSEKKITGEQALAKLAEFEQKNGAGADTDVIRENITNTMNAKPLVEDGKTKPAKIANATSGSTTAVKAGESATAAANISGDTNFTVDHPVIKEWIDKQRPELRAIERAKFNALSTTEKNQLGRHLTRTAKNPDGSSYSTKGGIDEVEIPTAEEMAEMSPERREFYEELAEMKARKSNPLSGSTTAVNAGKSATAAANIPGGGAAAEDDSLSPLSPAEQKENLKRIGAEIQAELDYRKKSGTSVAPNIAKSSFKVTQNGKVTTDTQSEQEIGTPSDVIDTSIEMGPSNIKRIPDNDLQRRLEEIQKETASTGTIASPATANTTVGKMVDQVAGGSKLLSGSTTAVNAGQSATAAANIPAAAEIKQVQKQVPKNNISGGGAEPEDDLLSPLVLSPEEKKENLKRIGAEIQAELDYRKKSGTSVAPNIAKSGHRIVVNGQVTSEAYSEREIGTPSDVIDTSIQMGPSNIKRITDNDLQRRLEEIQKETASTGTIASPATANTTVGKMVDQVAKEQNNLNQAKNGYVPTGSNISNTSNVQNKISTTNNNFNDDLRIRNNEPTQKQMQIFSLVP